MLFSRISLVVVMIGLTCTLAVAEERILYLKSGDTLEGTLVSDTDKAVSLRLPSGVVVTINRTEIDSVETPESISELQKEFQREVMKSDKGEREVNLHEVFKAVNPTPTPIPIRRLSHIQVRKKFKASQYRASILPNDADSRKQEPARVLPVIPEQDEEGNRNFGLVTYLESSPKAKRPEGGWEILERDQLLNPGDEINTLEGRLEITTPKGSVLRLEANTEVAVDRNKLILKRGKLWMQTLQRNPANVDVGNIALRLQPNGRVHIETLRAGNKISLADGEIRVHNLPDTPQLLKTTKSPVTLWVDGQNELTSEETFEPVLTARWDEWERQVRESFKPVDPSNLLPPPAAGSVDPAVVEMNRDLVHLVADAIDRYRQDVGAFPPEGENPPLNSLRNNTGAANWAGPYLPDLPLPIRDEFGTPLMYRLKILEGMTEPAAGIFSLGPNRQFEEGNGDDFGILISPSAPAKP